MGKIYCVMGKSSSGKDSIYSRIMQQGSLHFYALYRIPPGLAERERRMAGNMYLQMRHMYSSWKAQAR